MSFLDVTPADLEGADRITYRLEQTFRYDYDAPISGLRHTLRVLPPARHGDVHRRDHGVTVSGASARRRTRADAAGNTVVSFHAERVESSVAFEVAATVERVRSGSRDHLLPASALEDPRLLRPTRLTTADAAVRDLGAGLRRGPELADQICDLVHGALRYEWGVTGVDTTAGQALAGGVGVCQDHAHLMLALCRLHGLPARYVSGHLIGQGGTHAWVEVVVPAPDGAAAVAYDPCNGRRAHCGYLTVATGRDYADAAPTSGTYYGPGVGVLTASRRVGVVAAA